MSDDTTPVVGGKVKQKGIGPGGFLALFMLPAAFTYLSGLLLVAAVVDEGTQDDAGAIRITFLAVFYAIMALACVLRGRRLRKNWLVMFPVLAAVFDMFLGFIPLAPSILNILVLVIGVVSKPESAEQSG